jgi:hypothetical protein
MYIAQLHAKEAPYFLFSAPMGVLFQNLFQWFLTGGLLESGDKQRLGANDMKTFYDLQSQRSD